MHDKQQSSGPHWARAGPGSLTKTRTKYQPTNLQERQMALLGMASEPPMISKPDPTGCVVQPSVG